MRQTFDEFEHFTEVVGHADLQFTLPRLEVPFWSIAQRSIGQIHLQCGSEANGNIAEGAAHDGGYVLFVQRSGNRCHANGILLEEDMLLVSGPRGEFVLAGDNAHDWYSLFVPATLLMPRGLTAADLPVLPQTAKVLRPDPRPLAQLHSIVDRLQAVERTTPESLLESASVASAERDLVRTVRDILGLRESQSARSASSISAKPAPSRGRPAVERERVMRNALATIESCRTELPSVEQLAATVDVSERTLRTMFVEYFGMSPGKYLHLRGLHRTRVALREGTAETTVARVAAQYGFWDFGRFASQYRLLFGEFPSETLRKPRP
jgi:AraC family ethanolamine operon transcriptional activator